MEAVHSGVKGDVIDGSTGQPVQDAQVRDGPCASVWEA